MGCCVSSPVVVEDGDLQDGAQSKKDHVLQNFSAEAKADALLAMIPGRMFANGASNNACIFTQQGRKGTNQDAMVVWEVSFSCQIPLPLLAWLSCFRRTHSDRQEKSVGYGGLVIVSMMIIPILLRLGFALERSVETWPAGRHQWSPMWLDFVDFLPPSKFHSYGTTEFQSVKFPLPAHL